jgi:TIR domain/Restriction endonuclease
MTKPNVFISYATADQIIAKILMEALRYKGLDVSLSELHPAINWIEFNRTAISANAYLILLLSKSTSFCCNSDIEVALKELQSRDITLIPVLLDDCDIPLSLAPYQHFVLKNPVEQNLETLVDALRTTPKIDFEKLSSQVFEQLVVDLLQKLGFINLPTEKKDNGINAIVEFRHQDPFGAETRDIYAVETKLYTESRADLRTLRELALYTKSNLNIDKALLVTNGNLTSVARDWVNDAPKVTGVPIRVVDGTELKRLLLQNTDLVSKYFATNSGAITT